MVHLKDVLILILCLIKYPDIIPKPNKSGGFSITTGSVWFEIDVVEDDGVIDDCIVDVERSLPVCRTGLLLVTGAANGFNFGMLLWVVFST